MGKSRAAIAAEQPFEIPEELVKLLEPIDKVRPYEGNPRRGDIEAIKESLTANGLYRAPVARRETSEILINNHTYKAALELGATHIPIDWRSVPDADRARAIMLADNRTSDLASYDKDALAASLEKQAASKAGLGGTGFDRDALTAAIGASSRAGATLKSPDPTPPPKKPTSRKGKVYELGRHRLLCGDATTRDAWDKVVAGNTLDMIWTDPPYGVDLHSIAAERGRDHGDMTGDTDAAAAADVVRQALEHGLEHTAPGGPIYLCHPDLHAGLFHAAMTDAGWSRRQQLIWRKNSLVLGRQDYQWRHEAIAYGWRPGAGHRWYGGFDKTTVIENPSRQALEALEHADLVEIAWRLLEGEPGTIIDADRPAVAEHHPTAKPVDLVARHLHNSSPAGGHVADPFAGSGSTLIAAEQTGRTAYLVELEPGYCDVIRKRWEDLNADTDA